MNFVKQELLKEFFERYLNKKEVMYRLPSPLSIEEFWPEVLQHRKTLGRKLSLMDQNNNNFWFGINEKLTKKISYINKFASVDLFNTRCV